MDHPIRPLGSGKLGYVALALRRGEQAGRLGWAIYLPREHVRCPCVLLGGQVGEPCGELLYVLGPGHAAFVRVLLERRNQPRMEASVTRGRSTHRCPNKDCRQQLEIEEVVSEAPPEMERRVSA